MGEPGGWVRLGCAGGRREARKGAGRMLLPPVHATPLPSSTRCHRRVSIPLPYPLRRGPPSFPWGCADSYNVTATLLSQGRTLGTAPLFWDINSGACVDAQVRHAVLWGPVCMLACDVPALGRQQCGRPGRCANPLRLLTGGAHSDAGGDAQAFVIALNLPPLLPAPPTFSGPRVWRSLRVQGHLLGPHVRLQQRRHRAGPPAVSSGQASACRRRRLLPRTARGPAALPPARAAGAAAAERSACTVQGCAVTNPVCPPCTSPYLPSTISFLVNQSNHIVRCEESR